MWITPFSCPFIVHRNGTAVLLRHRVPKWHAVTLGVNDDNSVPRQKSTGFHLLRSLTPARTSIAQPFKDAKVLFAVKWCSVPLLCNTRPHWHLSPVHLGRRVYRYGIKKMYVPPCQLPARLLFLFFFFGNMWSQQSHVSTGWMMQGPGRFSAFCPDVSVKAQDPYVFRGAQVPEGCSVRWIQVFKLLLT